MSARKAESTHRADAPCAVCEHLESVDLYEENARLAARLDAVRALHREVHAIFAWAGENAGLRYEDPCPDCHGAPGVHPCGCWADSQVEYVCAECHRTQGGGRDATWPCATIRAITPEAWSAGGIDRRSVEDQVDEHNEENHDG